MRDQPKIKKPSQRRAAKFFTVLLGIFAALFVFCALLSQSFLLAENYAEGTMRVLPSYPKEDLTAVLEKDRKDWTDDDYALVSRQTGILSREAIDAESSDSLRLFQNAFFFPGITRHEHTAIITYHDYLADPETGRPVSAPMVALENGDVLLTSACHSFGWKNGHAALVVNASRGSLLESIALGMDSRVTDSGATWFCASANFMVLRMKGLSAEERDAIAKDAVKRLCGVPYSLFVGFFSPKDQCADGRTATETHCSHLVWQAYRNAGYDVDSNGGPLCAPQDLARCDLFEIVQIYGFDPDTLW